MENKTKMAINLPSIFDRNIRLTVLEINGLSGFPDFKDFPYNLNPDLGRSVGWTLCNKLLNSGADAL